MTAWSPSFFAQEGYTQTIPAPCEVGIDIVILFS